MTMPRPRIIIERDAVALAERAAERVVARARENTGEPAICLTGGSTPKRLYQLLATPEWRNQLPWQRVQWFIGDDRFVPPDDELSNIGMARHAFLDGCAPPENIHAIPTDAASPVEAAQHQMETGPGRFFTRSARIGKWCASRKNDVRLVVSALVNCSHSEASCC